MARGLPSAAGATAADRAAKVSWARAAERAAETAATAEVASVVEGHNHCIQNFPRGGVGCGASPSRSKGGSSAEVAEAKASATAKLKKAMKEHAI